MRKYCTALTTETEKRVIMAAHMGTWKYRLRMDWWRFPRSGTGVRNPAVKVYRSRMTETIFHQ